MTQVKEILKDILDAFCLSSQNMNKVYKLSGIKGQLYNGKRNNYQLRDLLLRAINDDTAKEIINNMPFPYIETANRHYIKEDRDNWQNILIPLENKRGNRLECVTQDYTIFFR